MMHFQPTRNGQYDTYHEMSFQQQAMGYPPHMQTCSTAGKLSARHPEMAVKLWKCIDAVVVCVVEH